VLPYFENKTASSGVAGAAVVFDLKGEVAGLVTARRALLVHHGKIVQRADGPAWKSRSS
jgi:hypothetical protein